MIEMYWQISEASLENTINHSGLKPFYVVLKDLLNASQKICWTASRIILWLPVLVFGR